MPELEIRVITKGGLGLWVCLVASFALPHSRASDEVAGKLIIFNDNGAWSWFEDERVIVDAKHGKVVLSSVANSHGPGGTTRGGDVDVVSYDIANDSKQRFTLSDQLQDDDHNSAALLLLPDGRYLASYSKHASDNRLRYRISVKAGDITAWQPEREFLTAAGTTYSNLSYLSKPNTIFNFHRDSGRGFDPNYVLWDVGTSTGFEYGGRLLTGPEENSGNHDRPYLRYVSNSVDRIHFIATDHHPRNLRSNSVYHGYIEHEQGMYGVYRSDGTRLGKLSTRESSPYQASAFTILMKGDTVSPANDLLMTRGWAADIELDIAGDPYVVFTARVNDSDLDHRFFYGRHGPEGWDVHELAKAGGGLYTPENDYTGLAALDPNNPDRLFIATNFDPRTDDRLTHYEIFQGSTEDGGSSWTWLPVTYNSSVDNLRPVVPRGPRGAMVLLWMRGEYNSYRNYSTRIVGLTEITPMKTVVVAGRPMRR